MKPSPRPPRRLRTVASAAASIVALAIGSAAHATISASGAVGTSTASPLGPGDTILPGTWVWVGQADGSGSLAIDGGSRALFAALQFGVGGSGNGSGVITGAGTRVDLTGDNERLQVGNWGVGQLTVSGGAQLYTDGNQAPCLVQFHYCDSFVGSAAGDTARFTVNGAGTLVSIDNALFVGAPILNTLPVNGFQFGVPGGTTNATFEVLAGARVSTARSQIGTRQWSSGNTGFERSVSNVSVAGSGSQWVLVGGQSWDPVTGVTVPFAASLLTANDRFAVANIDIRQGGELRVEGVSGLLNYVDLTSGGGHTDMLVRDAGSRLTFVGDAAVLNLGTSLGSAALTVSDGAQVSGVWYTGVGRNGSFGSLTIDGAGTLYDASGLASAAANGTAAVAVIDIGRGGGNGVVNVSNGGRLELKATEARVNSPSLSLGRDGNSAGTLNISGAGSTVLLSAASVAPDSAGEALNPFVRIGRDGQGTLNIGGGGKLLVEGDAVSTVANTRRTSVFIGGSGDSSIGGKGVATITGAGSELRVSGSDAYIGVGHGPQAVGSLGVANQASISATILGVGNYGGTGIARFDNARVDLTGQFTGSGEFGAALVIGAGNGATGNVTASNGSVIRISTASTLSGGVSLGGSRILTGGDGALTLNASSLLLDMPSNVGGMTVGRTGSGLLRLQSASVVDLGSNSFTVAPLAGADGTVIATGGSTLSAGWVGIGRRRDSATGDTFDGGTATMVLNGSTLNARDVVIGTNGFLGGTAGSINVSGSIVNYGIFSPGNSPGLFSINGDYVAGAGSRLILEVQSDGHGGFVTDEVRFGAGNAIELGTLAIEFRFLGDTDPNLFKDSGSFDIDNFVRQADASGAWAGLDASEYAGVSFSARADAYTIDGFSYSPGGGASFSAVPVPEPATWLTLVAGSAWLARRRPAGRV